MIRVVLVDDQKLVRAGMAALLERAEDITVVGEAGDGASGVATVRASLPDVVLMDIRMPGLDGIEATKHIVADERLADVKVVVLTTFDTDDHIVAAIRAGAAGFLLKNARPDQLRDAIRAATAGEAMLAPTVAGRVLRLLADNYRPPEPKLLDGLTQREREVLAELGTGKSNADIASTLFLSPATARTYVSRLLSKLAARDRAQLVVIAYESGLVRPGD